MKKAGPALIGLIAGIAIVLTGCASGSRACQPIWHNGLKTCRVHTPSGHVIFIPWVHYVPKSYVPDNPDHGYVDPNPVHPENPEPIHVNPPPPEVHPVIVDP